MRFNNYFGAVYLGNFRRSVKYQIRLEHERRDYTNALAHDIKTPLFIIGGNAETLLEISQNQAQKECAQNVLDCSKSANRLVEDMLDFSAFDGDSYVLNRERINLNDLVSDLLKDTAQALHLNTTKA